MISVGVSVRSMLWLAMLLAATLALLPCSALSAGAVPEACRRWPQTRLVVEPGLVSRRFVLEAEGRPEQIPPSLEAGGRATFHRTFSLSLDVAEPLALYRTGVAKTCVIARDTEKALPLRVPVFFVGRQGQNPVDLKADVEKTAFAPSASLGEDEDFAEVNFRLRRGGSIFGEIRPFFICGLPGLMLCEGNCPPDPLMLAQNLAGWVIKGVEWHPPAARNETLPRVAQQKAPAPSEPEASTKREMNAPAPPPPAPPPPHVPEQPAATPAAPAVETHAPPPPPVIEQPSATPVAPRAPQASPPPVTAPVPALRRLVLTFEHASGAQISAAEIMASEGSVRLEGALLTAAEGSLAADLPDEAYARAITLKSLREAFPHYRILSVRTEESRIAVTAEPVSAPEPVPAPPPAARAGLIVLVSTGSDFSNQVGEAAAKGFWAGALDLAASVSEGPWQTKLLARAQSPGPSEQTKVLEDLRDGKLATGTASESILKTLTSLSAKEKAFPPITGLRPIERFQLDLALEVIQQNAGIIPSDSPGQDSLLLITGGIDPAGSYFCRHPIRPDTSAWARPEWVRQARRVFVLEVWGEAATVALERAARAKPADGAPPGIYSCAVPGADGANVALYGVVPAALSEKARAGIFGYLKTQANRYLKPLIAQHSHAKNG